ncbi:MAG TPA: DUF3536 domain-containing protein, partial [Chloroflexota bacterium]|nr:DUF3536 domain-containing protein [Chloroflexota bacterium]
MERYVCVHGHFYQPPRENPWLEAIELQDSAYPYHDWNERIAAECYSPNGYSRILDGEGRIERIVNNYSRISFNFGPTLLAWMEDGNPDAYRAVLAADRESQELFSGHGSAMAQGYNHIIMPLANRRDKYTQVIWGIRDFEHRFGRGPEGMWLPEAAVDLETLDILAEMGIRFTLLSPHQASRVRKLGGRGWKDVSGGRIDPSRAYRLRLPSGRFIDLFFYDGPISQAVAFEGLLSDGESFANRLLSGFSQDRSWDQLVHIATDGESYGHHHKQGEMALSYALHHIESNKLARLTNYGEYLEKHPPVHEVEILENSAWSCSHGVGRWKEDCGCNSGGYPDWNQAWRAPLREALDWLRDRVAPLYEERAAELLKDPWLARDDYISVILDRSPDSRDRFIARYAVRELSSEERVTLWKLMEAQRHAMLMYTSCGWFFDEISGIETMQVIQYAGRVIQISEEVLGGGLEGPFLEWLGKAKSNLPAHGDGAQIYEKWVEPAVVDLPKVVAHWAVSSLFEDYSENTRIYSYTVDREDYQSLVAGEAKMAVGRIRIKSEITENAGSYSFGVLHFGGHNLNGGVRASRGEEEYRALLKEATDTFARADIPEGLRLLDRNFEGPTFSLKSIFKDEQRKVVNSILASTLDEAEAVYRQVYEHRAPLMRFLADLRFPLPKALYTAAEQVVGADLRRAFEQDELDLDRIAGLLDETGRWQFSLDQSGLGYTLRLTLERLAERLRANPSDLELLRSLDAGVQMARSLPFHVELFRVQNSYYEMLQTVNADFWGGGADSDEAAREWLDSFVALGEKLWVRVAELKANPIRAAPALVAMAEKIASQRRIPSATYRLQFNKEFTFRQALEIVPYLHALGISDLYASPVLMARPGSGHGYDICDHQRLNPELGTAEEFDALSRALKDRGMGMVLDVVPNHMGIGHPCNRWWMDVLENGPSSIYASYFDIHWHSSTEDLRDKVLLPILEDQYGAVLESGKLRLAYEDGAFFLYHYDTKLPVSPSSYAMILGHQLDSLVRALGADQGDVRELQSILTALGYLPAVGEREPERKAERNREKEVIKRRIAGLYGSSHAVQTAVDATVQLFNGSPADRNSFDRLDALLDAQP